MPPTATIPETRNCQNLHPAIIIIIQHVIIITIEVLTCGSNNSNPIIGNKNKTCLNRPFKKFNKSYL